MKRVFIAAFLTIPILATAILGCQISGRKTHLMQDNQYVNPSSGQVKTNDDSDGILDLLWGCFFE